MASVFVVFALLLVTCGGLVLAQPTRHGEGRPAADLSRLPADLTFELYAELAKQRPGENVLFSPLGVSSALLELSRACRALSLTSSQAEILIALGLRNKTEVDGAGGSEQTFRALDALVMTLVADGRGESQLSIQTILQHNDKTFSFGQPVNQSSGTAERKRLPDPGQSKNGDAELLQFLRTSTGKLIVSNKVQFTGKWKQPFDSRRTLGGLFHPNNTASVEVAMMYQDDTVEHKMLYDTNCSTTVVQLHYSGRLAAIVLLPRGAIQPLEECLSAIKMKFWLSNLKPGRVEIRLPKFTMKKSHTLEQALRTFGIQGVFSQQSLQLSQTLHEVELEVNESKAEDIKRPVDTIDRSEPHRIIFDRPFMLIVYDKITEVIILMGKILDPTAK